MTQKRKEKWTETIVVRRWIEHRWYWRVRIRRNWTFKAYEATGHGDTATEAVSQAVEWIDAWYRLKSQSGILWEDLYESS